MSIEVTIGLDIIRSYKRLAYTPWHALAELVDNSTQSYANNQTLLDAAYEEDEDGPLRVDIVYDRDAGFLRVSDNGMGMSYDELDDALKIGKAPTVTTGRSEFGMGLKTAACWLGDHWTVRTKKLGEEFEYSVAVDVERIASGEANIQVTETPKDPRLHYTVVEVTQLHKKLVGRTLGKVRQFLKSIYRLDLQDDKLVLTWDGENLEWDLHLDYLRGTDGSEFWKPLDFEVAGKRVTGWVAILGDGSRGRANAGFTIFRRRRGVRGWPDSWRPQEIFGQLLGSNNLINQRIAGEIHLDDWIVSHTKDDIQWEGDDEEKLGEELAAASADFIDYAQRVRVRMGDERGPSEDEVEAAVEELRTEMQTAEFVDLLEVEAVPSPDAIEESNRPLVEAAVAGDPRFVVTVGDHFTCKMFLAVDASPMDQYYESEVTGDTANVMSVVINTRHPHWTQLGDSESILTYLRQCVYDAIAEFQCRRLRSVIEPHTIKALKDRLLRLPSFLEEHRAN